MDRTRSERGAAAVEFALVFPLVIMLLITVIEFSRLWNIQATLTQSAAIGARYAAVHFDPAKISDVEADAADEAKSVPGLVDWDLATVGVTASCASLGFATSEISVSPGSITGWFGDLMDAEFDLQATGKMPCSG